MARWIATLLIVALAGGVGLVSAQQAPAPSTVPAMGEKTTEGTVKAVDPAKKQLTLEDGTAFTIPATVPVEWTSLTPGKTVAISYIEMGQQKMVRKVQVKS